MKTTQMLPTHRRRLTCLRIPPCTRVRHWSWPGFVHVVAGVPRHWVLFIIHALRAPTGGSRLSLLSLRYWGVRLAFASRLKTGRVSIQQHVRVANVSSLDFMVCVPGSDAKSTKAGKAGTARPSTDTESRATARADRCALDGFDRGRDGGVETDQGEEPKGNGRERKLHGGLE